MELIPRDGTTTDLQPLFSRLVRMGIDHPLPFFPSRSIY